ncbi:hypothetical protein GJV26_04260 [Massilia dura]|uniref:Uncharacterized protein n=1 Tax=Pseudoduganella dura TaxID=321982 RepID=A0A6I3XAP8_9BURK|nr:hypothetical protein [Pseudoduganella dura]MUI11700.1 hypothetical protein [Pseudoduganella dura]
MKLIENENWLISSRGAKMGASLLNNSESIMSFLEYFPIGLAVAGLVLRYALSKRSARAVQAWEASRPQDKAVAPSRPPAILVRTGAFNAA